MPSRRKVHPLPSRAMQQAVSSWSSSRTVLGRKPAFRHSLYARWFRVVPLLEQQEGLLGEAGQVHRREVPLEVDPLPHLGGGELEGLQPPVHRKGGGDGQENLLLMPDGGVEQGGGRPPPHSDSGRWCRTGGRGTGRGRSPPACWPARRGY